MTRMNWTAAIAAAAIAACLLPGCGNTKCKMDTECPLPQLCVSGECVFRATDTTVDGDVPVDNTDTWDADGVDLTDTDEIPDSIDVDTVDTTPTCTPVFPTAPRTTFGSLAVSCGPSTDPDRPNIMTVQGTDSLQVWAGGRIVNGETPQKISYVRLNPKTGIPTTAQYPPAGNLTIDKLHPAAAVNGGFVTIYPDLAGVEANKLFYWIVMVGEGVALPTTPVWKSISTSDAYSREPAVASSGTEVMAIWRQGCDACATSTIKFERLDLVGGSLGFGTIGGTGTEDLGTPAIAFGGAGYGVAWVAALGAGLDRVDFVEIDSAGLPISGSLSSRTVTSGMTVKGSPSIAWGGSEYAILWEEVDATAGNLHMSTVTVAAGPTYTPADVVLDDALSVTVGASSGFQDGMVDIEWNGDVFGVVWVYKKLSDGTGKVWFFELTPAGSLVGTPLLLNTGATNSEYPTLTWIENETQLYWVFAWDEFSALSANHVLFTYSYGCCFPEPCT